VEVGEQDANSCLQRGRACRRGNLQAFPEYGFGLFQAASLIQHGAQQLQQARPQALIMHRLGERAFQPGLSETASRGSGLAPVQRRLARGHQPLKPASINLISPDDDPTPEAALATAPHKPVSHGNCVHRLHIEPERSFGLSRTGIAVTMSRSSAPAVTSPDE
jgi:hypothetical protein